MTQTKPRRKQPIDATRMWELATELEQVLGPGYHLAHTHRMGWLLRHLESWPTPSGTKLVYAAQAPGVE